MENKTRWLFIDHENIGNIESLDTGEFNKIIVFVGATHKTLKIRFVQLNQNVTMEVIKIKNVGQNNLDFHLSYFLGKYDLTADSDVEFVVLSADKGFDHLIRFISDNGRSCYRRSLSTLKKRSAVVDTDDDAETDTDVPRDTDSILHKTTSRKKRPAKKAAPEKVVSSPQPPEDTQARVADIISKLNKMSGQRRPRKTKTLKNYIKTIHKGFEDDIFRQLITLQCIEENKSSITYSIDDSLSPDPVSSPVDTKISGIISKLRSLAGKQRPRKLKTLLNYIKNLKKGDPEAIMALLTDQNVVVVSEDGKIQYKV
ncbi:hypothetical protein KKI24_18645 [bacterium]|nr:hypothetical protein [bacterium]